MNAGRVLRAAGYDSPELRVRVAPVNPDQVNVYPASRALRGLWRQGVRGVTLWKWVLIDPEVMRGDQDRLAKIIIHELVHLRQYIDQGWFRFTVNYLGEYWRARFRGEVHRHAYLNISAEKEAREMTAHITANLT